MGSRLSLQARLTEILGLPNVYYQPPESLAIKYPAIVYSRDQIKAKYANDVVYGIEKLYEVIVIDADPDSLIIDQIACMPKCKFNRNYTANNLNHDVYILHY